MPPENQDTSQNQNQDLGQNQNQNTGTDDSNARLEALIKDSLGEAEKARRALEQQNLELRQRLEAAERSRQVVEAPKPKTFTKDDFFEDPVSVMDYLIGEQIKPLKETANRLTQNDEYSRLKSPYRSNPAFGAIEPIVDRIMAGKDPTVNNINDAVKQAVGELVLTNPAKLGLVENTNNGNTNVDDNKVTDINSRRTPDSQAHLKSTNRDSTSKSNTSKANNRRDLNESERRVMREMKLTEEQFWELIEADNKVDGWKKAGDKK